MHQDCITALKKPSQIAAPNSQNGTIRYYSLLKILDINGVTSAKNTAIVCFATGTNRSRQINYTVMDTSCKSESQKIPVV